MKFAHEYFSMPNRSNIVTITDQIYENRTHFILKLVLRFISCIMLIPTLWFWSQLLGLTALPFGSFLTLTDVAQSYVILLCVLYPVLAIGLWLPSAWSLPVWVIFLGIQLAFWIILPQYGFLLVAQLGGHFALLMIYIFLAYFMHNRLAAYRERKTVLLG